MFWVNQNLSEEVGNFIRNRYKKKMTKWKSFVIDVLFILLRFIYVYLTSMCLGVDFMFIQLCVCFVS